MAKKRVKRILAIDLTSRGFGFAVLEGPEELIDWGVKQPKPYNEDRCVQYVEQLIVQYRPHALILEDCEKKTPKRSRRVESLLDRIARLAQSLRLPIKLIPWTKVRKAFRQSGHIKKFGITRIIARLLPVLATRMPPFRKPWMSEDYRMAIFDAVALGLTFYNSLREFRNFLHDKDD